MAVTMTEEHLEQDVDAYADCPQVWCTFSDGPARALDGFCEHCGTSDHDSW